ncbi:cysteine desulfurase family protein [uncultured Prochlorococcus sp.]|uniref:cysteine desulfurase family protein n=1 Tax=uncultured Prochlorococcus sp. TaxID=159733 RepID=UPI002582B6DC|nr:aminotransferase class V-fold PLP-dependent enzyme [uncultured Prochlorococcus sp.]
MKNNFIYLDNASTTPLSENVLNIINSTYKNYWYNPSSTYELGIKSSKYLEKIRSKIACIFDAEPEDIIFTSGSSESTNIVFSNIYETFKNGRVVISNVEHQATTICVNKLRNQNWDICEWTVNNEGILNISNINKTLTKETKLASIIWGQSEIGTIQPVQFIGSKCKELNILFHLDGTQIISNGIFSWKDLNCDFLSLSAHKFGGPKGIGILLTNEKSRVILKNKDISITQEYSIRQGTQALPLIAGMHESLKNIKGKIKLYDYITEFPSNNINKLKNYFFQKIKDNNHIIITGSIKNRLPNHISFLLLNKGFEAIKAYKIVNFMSQNNIAISSGSACSSSSGKASSTLKNIGFKNDELYSNIRVTLSSINNKSEIDKFLELIQICIDKF